MNWLDDRLAIGGMFESGILREDIDVVVDVRPLFHNGEVDAVNLLATVEELVDLSDTKRIYVHCTLGRDRGPFVGMVYLSMKYGLSYEEAYELVREKRPQAREHWEWVNSLF